MHASTDIRVVRCLDGLHYSFEMLSYIHTRLYNTCAEIRMDQTKLIPALLYCWSFVDVVHRLREVGQAIPGLSQKNPELCVFLKETAGVEESRHYIQHLRNELQAKPPQSFPVWGSLSWVDPKAAETAHTVVIGARLPGTSYGSCVYDNYEKNG